MKTFFIVLFIVLCYPQAAYCQGLHVNWTKFIGQKYNCCIKINYAIQSRDNCIVFTGYANTSDSTDGDIPGSTYGGVMVGKMDSNHNLIWIQVYGGYYGWSICQTQDGGYAVLAYTEGVSGHVTGYHGNGDMWLIKIDSSGNYLWSNCYGSNGGDEQSLSVAATKDNGLILLGISNGSGQDVPFHLGGSEFEYDWFVVKTDSLGNKQWTKDLGGSDDEATNGRGSIIVANDGYYLVSSSSSTDHDCTDNYWHIGANTLEDFYILKLDTAGNVEWDSSYGGSGYDQVYNAIWDPRDSSIVITGATTSSDYIFTGAIGGMCIVKTRKDGSLKWAKTYHGGIGYSINLTESGYALYGSTSGIVGNDDLILFTLDTAGNVIADTAFGGTNDDEPASAFPYKQGYIATGDSNSTVFTDGDFYGISGIGHSFISYLSCCPNPASVQSVTNNNEQISVYPNPSTEWIRIKLPATYNEQSNVSITNAIGEKIYERKIIQQQDIDVNTESWAKGIYIVRWRGEDGTVLTTKLSVY